MKATPEILTDLEIDNYLYWLKDIYTTLFDLSSDLEYCYNKENKISIIKYNIKLNEIKQNKEYSKRKNCILEIENNNNKEIQRLETYLDYVIYFIPIEKLKELTEKKHFELLEYVKIDFTQTVVSFELINGFANSIIQEIEQKAKISKHIIKTQYNNLLNKDYSILREIINIDIITGLDNSYNIDKQKIINEFADLKTLKYLYDKINNQAPETPTPQKKGTVLSEKQRVLLYHYLTKYKIIRPEKIHPDKTGQTFILLSLFGTPTNKENVLKDNFYKYQKNITKLKTKQNLKAIFEVITHLNNKEMYLEIEQEIKKRNQ